MTLVENSTDFIGMCDLAGVPFFVNRAGLDLVGLDDRQQAIATPLTSFFFPEDRESNRGPDALAAAERFLPHVILLDIAFRRPRLKPCLPDDLRSGVPLLVSSTHDTAGSPPQERYGHTRSVDGPRTEAAPDVPRQTSRGGGLNAWIAEVCR